MPPTTKVAARKRVGCNSTAWLAILHPARNRGVPANGICSQLSDTQAVQRNGEYPPVRRLGALYPRIKSRLGSAWTLVATAPRIARTAYPTLRLKLKYHAKAADEYERRFRQRETKYLELARMLQATARSESVRCPSNAEGHLKCGVLLVHILSRSLFQAWRWAG